MGKSKLISLRMNEETIKFIDDYCSKRSYFSRTYVIQHIVDAVIKCSSPEHFWKLMESYYPYSEGIIISVTKKDKIIS